jgi:isopentenyl phosphate kinase
LSNPKPTILKIGGSVITDKSQELGARTDAIDRLANEIQTANIQNLIIVHGGGSFGHPIAQKYRIKEGYKEKGQIVGFSETHHVMTVLNGLFMDALIWRGVSAVSIAPSSCIMTKNRRIECFDDSTLRTFVQMGFLPVLYGDAVLDTELGFTILSGDQLISFLAMHYDANRIVIGVDVDGLYEADPKAEKNSRMFLHLNLEEVKKIQGKIGNSNAFDVTGGMSGKITELLPAIERGIPVTIVNASKPDCVHKALKGEKVNGTVIEK